MKNKIKIMFVCHGNICRSPMAEFIFSDMVEKKGLSEHFSISSSATSREEIGHSIYPQAKKKLEEMDVPMYLHKAIQFTKADYISYDIIVCMDDNNIRNLNRIISSDSQNKVSLLLEFADEKRSVADPWYTGNFDVTYNDVVLGCNALLKYCCDRYNIAY